MEDNNALFDQIDAEWRQHGEVEHPCGGLEVIRFGGGQSPLKFRQLDVEGRGNRLIASTRSAISDLRLTIRGHNNTIFIGGGGKLRGISMRMSHENSLIAIGRDVTTAGLSMIAGEGKRILVGEDCLFSHGIWVRNTDMHPIYSRADGRRVNDAADVTIGRHVWIGQDVRISKGATIGEGSVIGTSALVSGDIPANCVAAGVPAKVLQQDIQWDHKLVVGARTRSEL